MIAQRAKIYELVLLNNIFVQLFRSSFGSFFLVFPNRRLSATFDIQIDLKWNIFKFGSQFRSIFRTLSNIQGRGFCINSERHSVFDYFAKSSILDIWQDPEFALKASSDFANKASSQMFDSALNSPLITSKNLSITVLCTVKSTWIYFQHIC